MQPETAHPITASILFMCAPPFRGRTLALPQLIDVGRTDTACRGGRRCPALCQAGREEAGGGEGTQPVVFVFVFPRRRRAQRPWPGDGHLLPRDVRRLRRDLLCAVVGRPQEPPPPGGDRPLAPVDGRAAPLTAASRGFVRLHSPRLTPSGTLG